MNKRTSGEASILNDSGCERSVLSAILNHGSDLLIDIEEILDTKDFYWAINRTIFSIIKHLVHEKNLDKFDGPTIVANAKIFNYNKFDGNSKESEYLEALFANTPTYNNAKSIALQVYKLSLARQSIECVNNVSEDLKKINGQEKIDEIIGKLEDPIFEFTSKLSSKDKGLLLIHHNIEERLKALAEDPKDLAGLPTGFPNWDSCIGGGFRRGCVNVIGARAKVGKSTFCLNVAKNMAELGIPILYLDTEMDQSAQQDRLTSLVTGISLSHIETGQFSTIQKENETMFSNIEKIKNLPITHVNIAGESIEASLSLTRRWIIKNVGIGDNGYANESLIIYDYLKLMNSDNLKGNIQETQLLGFLITALHNFAVKFGISILASVQLNRDGVEKEGAEVISGSDRILWLCSNFTILKKKSQEELIEDPPKNGMMKLVVTDTRFGGGHARGDYINLIADFSRAKLTEAKMLSQSTSAFLNEKI
jgi:replicative DNA helicase